MTDTMYKRFWFEFDLTQVNFAEMPPGIGQGCGVTAFDYFDALHILDKKVFKTMKRPAFQKVVENVDIRTLDKGHVIPNMSAPVYRGVWYPLGYE